ncbi:peptide deformylase [Candidatus Latescibacterota bacterium]
MTGDYTRIHIYGDSVLRKISEEVTDFDGGLCRLVENMTESMYVNNGIGLAGPQVGVSQKITVIDLSFGEEVGNTLTLINPQILEKEGESTGEEGCLSVPGIYEDITRAEKIAFRYQDLDGNIHEKEAEDFLARVILHETDHLDGILFVDRLSTVKRKLLSKQLRSLAQKCESK